MKPEQLTKFFSDLYRDLVDRRLLFPLIALVVAIVAVPILLSSSAEPPVAPAAPQADLDGTTAVDAAVIVSDTGIRNYRERLEELKTKNPFEQQYAGTPAADGTATDPVTGSGLPDSGSPSDTSTSSGSTGGSVDVSTGGPTVQTGPPSTVPSEQPEVETSVRFFADRVDVKVGPIGHTKILRDVRHLDFLPDDKTPVAAFLGLAGGPDHAIFSINPAVIESGGDGSCAPKEADGCQYLNLAIGDERFFKYGFGDDAETYRLKLLDTNIVRIPDPRDERGSDEDSSD
jgi:hypothetical protein